LRRKTTAVVFLLLNAQPCEEKKTRQQPTPTATTFGEAYVVPVGPRSTSGSSESERCEKNGEKKQDTTTTNRTQRRSPGRTGGYVVAVLASSKLEKKTALRRRKRRNPSHQHIATTTDHTTVAAASRRVPPPPGTTQLQHGLWTMGWLQSAYPTPEAMLKFWDQSAHCKCPSPSSPARERLCAVHASHPAPGRQTLPFSSNVMRSSRMAGNVLCHQQQWPSFHLENATSTKSLLVFACASNNF
jgi:hypothetical protein